ncbi:hypothetical protein T459_16678 [Capsicum annuum]|uniref:PATROL1-like C-terminal domain-containing protein n=1 Tax=Capsicum annuum TaxID=4072 RepID=A0A2G2Z9F3_CAPAN|nr:hypothetical protein T459_16678 [Capsicum annuum]
MSRGELIIAGTSFSYALPPPSPVKPQGAPNGGGNLIRITRASQHGGHAPCDSSKSSKADENSQWTSNWILVMCSELVDELFVPTFDCILDIVADAIKKTCELVGAKFMFSDMREPFLFNLYQGGCEGARLETILPQFNRAETMIQLLMTSSEHSSIGLEAHKYGHRHLGDAHTLVRDELEHLLDDDEDMAEMYFTDKLMEQLEDSSVSSISGMNGIDEEVYSVEH